MRLRRASSFALCLTLSLSGCATGKTREIALGMLAGGAVGAIVGHEFVHHGQYKQYQSQDTLITAVLFALVVGGAMDWHYQTLQEQAVEISGRYSRYRLCNPEEMPDEVTQKLAPGKEGPVEILKPEQIGKMSIHLDDNTRWVYPTFRKRLLQPERSESEVISQRYIWEILKPGNFVTRSQDPQYFAEPEEKK